jgi:hypothetical protein
LTLQGRDLSQLHPIIPVPFPWTPAYQLRGRLVHDGEVWTFRDFSGHVGQSDVAASLRSPALVIEYRPLIEGDIVSQRLDLCGSRRNGRLAARRREAGQGHAGATGRGETTCEVAALVADPSLRSGESPLGRREAAFPGDALHRVLDSARSSEPAVINLEAGVMTLQPLDSRAVARSLRPSLLELRAARDQDAHRSAGRATSTCGRSSPA